MDSSSTDTQTPATSVRKLRSFLDELMAAGVDTPALCHRIQAVRKGLYDQWKADHPGEKGNPFSQEKVAARIGDEGITTGAYGDFERKTEPSMGRLRQIAKALDLDENYFTPEGDPATAMARLEAEADRLARAADALTALLERIERLLPPEGHAQAPDEPD